MTSLGTSRSMNVRSLLGPLLAGLGAALIAACGGGVDTGGTGAPPVAFSSGSVTGFGSVIVNAIRFDDSAAAVSDEDGNRRNRDDLRLGMSVEVDSSAVTNGSSGAAAVASSIRYGGELLGTVESVNPAAQRLVVLGQTVAVDAATVFDAALGGGLAAVTVGSVLEVHAQFDASAGIYRARRIEPRSGVLQYRLRGVVSSLDATRRRFAVGALTVSYASLPAAEVPATLANARFVKLRLQTVPVAGVWVAVKLQDGVRQIEDRQEARVRGLISAFTSATQFSVDGQPVDASGATFPNGSAGLGLGARAKVEGRLAGGVLRASKVEIESPSESESFELHGSVSALDATAKTFVVRGLTVSYAGNVEFRDGSAADLANGRNVEVRATLAAGSDQLQATRIRFE